MVEKPMSHPTQLSMCYKFIVEWDLPYNNITTTTTTIRTTKMSSCKTFFMSELVDPRLRTSIKDGGKSWMSQMFKGLHWINLLQYVQNHLLASASAIWEVIQWIKWSSLISCSDVKGQRFHLTYVHIMHNIHHHWSFKISSKSVVWFKISRSLVAHNDYKNSLWIK